MKLIKLLIKKIKKQSKPSGTAVSIDWLASTQATMLNDLNPDPCPPESE